MTITNGGNLGLFESAADGEAHGPALRAFLRAMDFFGEPIVKAVGTNTPPASPANGDAYVVGTSPTGAWAGKASNIARYSTIAGGWEFFTPKANWWVANQADGFDYYYTGSAWAVFSKADSLLAHLAGTETFTGLKTFSAGLNLGGTANLTAYDEGTWTPTATNLGGTGISYSTKWTKVGNRADFVIQVAGTGLTATANTTTLTLPFTPARNSSGCISDDIVIQAKACTILTDGKVHLPTMSSSAVFLIAGTIYLN